MLSKKIDPIQRYEVSVSYFFQQIDFESIRQVIHKRTRFLAGPFMSLGLYLFQILINYRYQEL